MQQALNFGSFSFSWYGFLVATGVIIICEWSKKYAKFYCIEPRQIDNFLFLGSTFSLIGARLFHILTSLSYYLENPSQIFFLWNGGLGILGAIIGLVAAVIIFCFKNKIEVLNFLNLIFPPFLVSQAIGRIGNYFNNEAFGPPTNLPWKIYIPTHQRPLIYQNSEFYHPTFFYESILCLIGFIFFNFLIKKNDLYRKIGFAYYLITYGSIRFCLEFLRLDTPRLLIQVICLFSVIVGTIFLTKAVRK